MAPIIHVHDGQRLALPARWGLIPSWSKDDKIAQHTFNARAETITEKPSFRAAFKRRRCIVPVSAFFEWRAIPGEKKKQKLRFSSPDAAPLAIAGLWESWTPPETGETVESYTIITTSANEFMAPIHDRMPAILGKADWEAWLDPEAGNPLLLESMLQSCRDDWSRPGRRATRVGPKLPRGLPGLSVFSPTTACIPSSTCRATSRCWS